MALINLQTDLKSLKYSKDRPDGGYSGQPYIQTSINPDSEDGIEGFLNSTPDSKDFVLRGGLRAPLSAANDDIRLSKYFTDFKSPSGFLFIAKQNLLSRTAVRTQSSRGPINEGVYTPLSTLTQAGSGYLGEHVNKQGSNPFQGVRTYMDMVDGEGILTNSIKEIPRNRLVDFYNTKINTKSVGNTLYSYGGGPGSSLGIGSTDIKLASERTGINSTNNLETYQIGVKNSNTDFSDLPFYSPLISDGVTNIFKNEFNPENIEIGLNNETNGGFGRNFNTSVYNRFDVNDDSTFPLQSTNRIYDNKTLTWDQEKIEEQTTNNDNPGSEQQDFRTEIIDNPNSKFIMSTAPSYNPSITSPKTYEGKTTSRLRIMSPGLQGDRKSYTTGKVVNGKRSVVDLINFQPIYQSENVKSNKEVEKNDLVKFRIAAINKENPNKKQFIHFRAFINNFSDSYGAQWTGQKYMGRGEEFYKYGGFSRDINIGFTVAAQSKPELMAQYKKLNFLASNLAPTYSKYGYMGGPLVQFTMGGWCYELPGFIESLNLEVPSESPWEIGINDDATNFDNTVKEMPHIVNCTMKFKPIHKFIPQKQENSYGGKPDGDGEISRYGDQHFIQLQNGENNNYLPVSLQQAQDKDFDQGWIGNNEDTEII